MFSTSTQITNMQVGRRATEKENLPNNWEPLDINKLTVPRNKSIFVFGGNTTTRPDAANGNAKIVTALLSPDNLNSTEIYSFIYETEVIRSNGMLSKDYEQSAQLLYEKTFKPILFDDKGNIKQKKGIEQAFNKIVFVAHCGGSNFVNIIVDQLHKTLSAYYSQSTADLLIGKIQYFAYAPNEMSIHNTNSLFITPYNDPSYSWSKSLGIAENSAVDIDYPKGVAKELIKSKKRACLKNCFASVFGDTRAIMFKSGQSTYIIPGAMNPRTSVGDHSIECIAKQRFLNSGTDLEVTARIANYASRLYLNEFLRTGNIDTKNAFNKISTEVSNHSTDEHSA